MGTLHMNSICNFMILRCEIPPPYFMVYPDVGNLTEWLQDVPAELVGIHLKEELKVSAHGAGQFRDLCIGQGGADFPSVFEAFREIDYSDPFVIEMWAQNSQWQENILDSKKQLLAMMQYIESYTNCYFLLTYIIGAIDVKTRRHEHDNVWECYFRDRVGVNENKGCPD